VAPPLPEVALALLVVGLLDRDPGTADLPLDREAGIDDLPAVPRAAAGTADLPAPRELESVDLIAPREAGTEALPITLSV
jgi:hypothetical protein